MKLKHTKLKGMLPKKREESIYKSCGLCGDRWIQEDDKGFNKALDKILDTDIPIEEVAEIDVEKLTILLYDTNPRVTIDGEKLSIAEAGGIYIDSIRKDAKAIALALPVKWRAYKSKGG